jgi:hypothetical protein
VGISFAAWDWRPEDVVGMAAFAHTTSRQLHLDRKVEDEPAKLRQESVDPWFGLEDHIRACPGPVPPLLVGM